MNQQAKVRLLIADDHEMIRSGVKGLLADTEIKVIAEADNCLLVYYRRGQGGRRRMEKARMLRMEEAVGGGTPDPAVPEKPVRRRFVAESWRGYVRRRLSNPTPRQKTLAKCWTYLSHRGRV